MCNKAIVWMLRIRSTGCQSCDVRAQMCVRFVVTTHTGGVIHNQSLTRCGSAEFSADQAVQM